MAAGLLPAAVILAALVWSIARPCWRLWPPHRSTVLHKILVWVLTMAIFASAVALRLLGWGTLALPGWLRWGFGLPLVVAGNAVVWSAIAGLGLGATSGEAGAFLVLWDRTNAIFRASPGYVSARLCEALPDQLRGLHAPYTDVNVAEWRTAASYAAALGNPEIRGLASDYRAVSTFDPAMYHVIRSV